TPFIMKKIFLYIPMLLVFAGQTLKAQVLFSEDFDSYPTGHLNTDYTGITAGQGGWYVTAGTIPAIGMVATETGKGNVLEITTNTTGGSVNLNQANYSLASLWNNRTKGNNIFKFEYEFYGNDVFNGGGGIVNQASLINIGFQSNGLDRIIGNYYNTTNLSTIVLSSSKPPLNTWIKAEMFIDYNTNKVYFYLPTLNIQKSGSFSHNRRSEERRVGKD